MFNFLARVAPGEELFLPSDVAQNYIFSMTIQFTTIGNN